MINTGCQIEIVSLRDYFDSKAKYYPKLFLGEKGYVHSTNAGKLSIEFNDADIDLFNNFTWHKKNVKVL